MSTSGWKAPISENTLHELLFLTAYGDIRGAVPKPRQVGPGLVAAILIELNQIGAVAWPERRAHSQPINPYLPRSRSAVLQRSAVERVVKAAEASTSHRQAAHWMHVLGMEVHEYTESRLSTTGLVVRRKRRKLAGGKEILIVRQTGALTLIQAKLLTAAKGLSKPDPASAALCGLVATLRLESTVEPYAGSKFASELRAVSVEHLPHFQQILTELEDVLITDQMRGKHPPLG